MKPNHLLFLATATMAATGLAGCHRSQDSAPLPPASGSGAPSIPTPPVLDSNTAQDSSSQGLLRATGTTHALRQASLGPKASGVLAAVLVEEGDQVRKGQLLFRLESTTVNLQVRQAEAGLAQAQVALDQAELDYKRTEPLASQGTISPATWDQVRLGYERAKVAVHQSKVTLASARSVAADASVRAPFAGVIATKLKNAGETVTMMPPTTVLVLQDISKIEVRTRLSESILLRIKPGQPMNVRFPSLGVTRNVPIDRINPAVDPLSRTVEVVGVLANPDREFKAGMLVEVTFPDATPPTARLAVKPAVSAASAPSTPTSKVDP